MSIYYQSMPRAEWLGAIEERAAILEYDNGLNQDEAERQAINEYLDLAECEGWSAAGIVGEWDRAAKRRFDPLFQDVEQRLKLDGVHAPMWGWGYVVPEGRTYRPVAEGEDGHVAIIVPCFDDYGLVDLVAHGLQSGRRLSRLGSAEILGLDAVEMARELNRPLLVFHDPYIWLRGNTLGAVIIDWTNLADHMSGITRLLCSADTAPKLYEATRECWPQPEIGVYAPTQEASLAA